jgi:hypothetical protein
MMMASPRSPSSKLVALLAVGGPEGVDEVLDDRHMHVPLVHGWSDYM